MKKSVILILLLAAVSFPQQRIAGGYGEIFFAPQYSPDGTMLAFTSDKYKGIWIYTFSDKSIRQLTDEISSGYGFSWSQDSKSLLTRVAVYEDIKRLNAVKIFDVMTGESVNLSGYKTVMPSLPKWTEGDSKVSVYSDKLEIYNTGKTANPVSNSGRIVLVNKNKIAAGDISSPDIQKIEPFKDRNYINVSLSPDASKILFELVGGSMYVMNFDGSGLVDLGKGDNPRWSPDGNSVIYMITEDDGHVITSSDIYIINADATEKINITSTSDKLEMNPSFSPDGKSVVYDEAIEGAIYIMNINLTGDNR